MRWQLLLAALTGIAAGGLRFLATTGLPNDHYITLTRGAQMLYGDWPVRDFVDPGLPLMYAVSAVMQAVGGRTLYPEALLVAAAYGCAAALTVWAVCRWCGSILLGLWAAFAEFAIFPRSYSYPKVLLYVIAAWAFVGYARQPTGRRSFCLAVLTLVAFLFRHDHGLFIGVAALVLVAAAAYERGGTAAAAAAVRFAALAGALGAPYLLYLQLHGGLDAYATAALEFSRAEADRTVLREWPRVPVGESPWSPAALSAGAYYLFHALPVFTVVVLLSGRRRWSWPQRGVVLAGVVVAAATNVSFLRHPLEARLPDAVVPAVLLTAWLAREAWVASAGRRLVLPARAVLAAVLAMMAAASATIGAFSEQIDRAHANRSPRTMAARWVEVTRELREPLNARHMPSRLDGALIPFFTYVRACTAPADRLLVTGFAPEVPYYAGRAFAGGHVSLFAPYYSSERDQHAMLRRLAAESVPLVVMPPESAADFAAAYPLVHGWVSFAYQLVAEIEVDGYDSPVKVLVRRELAGAPAFAETSWPCVAQR